MLNRAEFQICLSPYSITVCGSQPITSLCVESLKRNSVLLQSRHKWWTTSDVRCCHTCKWLDVSV